VRRGLPWGGMLPSRQIGRHGPSVSALGLGTMGMSEGYYGPSDDASSADTIRHAVDLGVSLIDTADVYGTAGHNEMLVGRALEGVRDRVTLATKTGLVQSPDGLAVDARPERIRRAAEESLRRLRTDRIDLYYLHRVDPRVPVEESVGAMAGLVAEGLVRHIGLSEVGPATLRRAHAVHPVAAVQSEYSLWNRDPEARLLPVMRELGVALIAFSPLGRGFLAGALARGAALDDDDMRRRLPRFQGENLARNLPIAERVAEIAGDRGATPAQVALAWVLSRGDDVIPIPGTRRRENVASNVAAAALRLGPEDLARLDDPALAPSGDRYPPDLMDLLDPEVRTPRGS
jgi:aryl-alcohol dehydrogenase-like predicted oxidoreductase